jgi:hypothetical protein
VAIVVEARQKPPALRGLLRRAPARLQDRGQALDVAQPILVAEDMEQAPVDHGVEALAPVLQRQGVFDQEGDLHAPLVG